MNSPRHDERGSTSHPAFERLQAIFDGPSDSPWLFGVCCNLARRNDWPVWAVRTVALLALIILTIPTLICYLTFGLAMDQTNARTRRMMRQGFIAVLKGIRALVNKLQGRGGEPVRDY